jgi:calcium/proton exchanger cax
MSAVIKHRGAEELPKWHGLLEEAEIEAGPGHHIADSPGTPSKMSPAHDAWGPYLHKSVRELVCGSKLNVLMLLTPLALAARALHMSDGMAFLFALLSIAPFAERLGFVTEQLALHTNDTVGGLLNATFGNATELIICVFALKQGLIRVIQVSLLGSILSNMLLVLGCAFLCGGLQHKVQRFNKAAATTSIGMLMLGVMSLAFPAALEASGGRGSQMAGATPSAKLEHELHLSRLISVVLCAM